ncbi:MAG: oligoribonuclease [Gammaproteobacteria bacterium]|nr:oligoribonuclease [Gammaproteobacteria bacterium]
MHSNLTWIDLEMTGLDPDQDVILEIATIVTDSNLNVLDEGMSVVVAQSEECLARMDDWNLEHHTASGLLDRVRSSESSLEEAEAVTLDLVSRHSKKGESPLCGNSVWQDRRFLKHYMPTLEDYLHYRIIDVSSLKELVRRWAPPIYKELHKAQKHRALEDIKESIAELRLYRQKFVASDFG